MQGRLIAIEGEIRDPVHRLSDHIGTAGEAVERFGGIGVEFDDIGARRRGSEGEHDADGQQDRNRRDQRDRGARHRSAPGRGP